MKYNFVSGVQLFGGFLVWKFDDLNEIVKRVIVGFVTIGAEPAKAVGFNSHCALNFTLSKVFVIVRVPAVAKPPVTESSCQPIRTPLLVSKAWDML